VQEKLTDETVDCDVDVVEYSKDTPASVFAHVVGVAVAVAYPST
jgi:hypothetical protein